MNYHKGHEIDGLADYDFSKHIDQGLAFALFDHLGYVLYGSYSTGNKYHPNCTGYVFTHPEYRDLCTIINEDTQMSITAYHDEHGKNLKRRCRVFY